MAFGGALSSLGAGSGVLTYNVIDKLKKADEAAMIDPFKTRLDNTKKKETNLSDLITQISLLKTSVTDFKDGEIFQKRLADVSGSSVSADVKSGVKVQTISMDVSQLAKNDIYQSKGYDSKDSKINDSGDDQTIHLEYEDSSKDITIKDGATLSDLKDAINNSDIGVTASIIDTGSDSDPYKLVLKGKDTGKDNIIKLDYSNIDDLNLNDTVYKSAKYDDDTDKVNDSGDTQTFKVTVNGTEYKMDVDDGTTVKDFDDKINNGDLKDSDGNSLGGISAKYEDKHIKFHMEQIGDISIKDDNFTTKFNDNTDFTNDNRVQPAQNSKFKYNGVDVERDKNKVTDLVVGLTLNLNSTGSSTVKIKQDTDTIEKDMQDFTKGYNSLVSKIQTLTKYDPDSKIKGVFQNQMDIKNIPNDISNALFNSFATQSVTKSDRNGEQYDTNISLNASDFGFSQNRTGFLDFDSAKFDKMLKNNPNETEKFLTGDNGAITKILNTIDNLTKGSNATLNLLDQEYQNDEKSFQNTIEDTQKRIDSKYSTMAQQFASYDEMINSFNVQSQSLQQQIDAMINAK